MSARTRKLGLVLLLGIGLCALLLGLWLRPSEPAYQGKSLSEWIAPFCRETKKGLDAPAGPEHFQELQPTRQAILAMGTNAVPFLIAQLNHQESSMHRKLRQLLAKQPYAAFKLAEPRVGRIRAIRALAVLGPLAQPAVPALQSQLADPALAVHAIYALQAVGAEGMQALVNGMTNPSVVVRMQIDMALISYSYRLGQTNSFSQTNSLTDSVMVVGLARIAQDSASPITMRSAAVQRLSMLRTNAAEAVPILVPLLSDPNPMIRQSTIFALGQIGAHPDSAVPALSNLLNSTDISIRMTAWSALQRYGYHSPPPNAGLMDFRAMQPRVSTPGTNFFGPQARPIPPPPLNKVQQY